MSARAISIWHNRREYDALVISSEAGIDIEVATLILHFGRDSLIEAIDVTVEDLDRIKGKPQTKEEKDVILREESSEKQSKVVPPGSDL